MRWIPMAILSAACAIEPAEGFGTLEYRLSEVEGRVDDVEGEITGEGCECEPVDVDALKAEILAEVLAQVGTGGGTDPRVGAIELFLGDHLGVDTLDLLLAERDDQLASLDVRVAEAERFLSPHLDGAATFDSILDGVTGIDPGYWATVADLTALDGRVGDIEADYTVASDLGPYATDADLLALDSVYVDVSTYAGDAASLDGRVSFLESDHVSLADLAPLATTAAVDAAITGLAATYATVADVSALSGIYAAVGEVTAIDARVDALEVTALDAADLVPYATTASLTAAIDGLASVYETIAAHDADVLFVSGIDLTGYASAIELDALEADVDARVGAIESDYATAGDLAAYATVTTTNALDARLDVIEPAYLDAADLAPYALTSTVNGINTRLIIVEGTYLDASDLAPYATTSTVNGINTRLTTVEGAYLDAADLSTYATLTVTNALDSRLDVIEPAYLDAADLAPYATTAFVSSQISGLSAVYETKTAHQNDVDTIVGLITTDYVSVIDLGTTLDAYATLGDLGGYATVTDLLDYAELTDLADYALLADLDPYVTVVDLAAYATTASVSDALANYETISAHAIDTNALDNRVDDLEAAALTPAEEVLLTDLSGVVQRIGSDVMFEGVNLHIRNGAGDTIVGDGTGNLILGYNLDTADTRSGSHNLVIGDGHTYIGSAGIVTGSDSNLLHDYGSVIGGDGDSTTVPYDVVLGAP